MHLGSMDNFFKLIFANLITVNVYFFPVDILHYQIVTVKQVAIMNKILIALVCTPSGPCGSNKLTAWETDSP